MAIRHFVWGAALTAALSVTLVAQQQQAPSGFHQVYCVKVNHGKDAEFSATINGDLRKLAQYHINSGSLSAWLVLSAVVPAGKEARCDYAFVNFFPGLPPAPMSNAENAAELQKAIGKTPQQFGEELESGATLVSDSIVHTALQVGAAKEGDYIVVNYMNVPDQSAWIDNEKKLWQPIFEDGVKDGSVDGWGVETQFMPRGTKDRDITYTVDIYPNWQAVYNFFGPSFPDRWKKANPNLPIDQGMAQEGKVDTIEHTALYHVDTELQK